MIIVVHSDYLGYILIRHLNHNTRFTMDFLFVQFHSTIKQNKSSYLLSKTNSTINSPISMRIAIIRVRVDSIEPGRLKSPLK